jgi:hypothetical protein
VKANRLKRKEKTIKRKVIKKTKKLRKKILVAPKPDPDFGIASEDEETDNKEINFDDKLSMYNWTLQLIETYPKTYIGVEKSDLAQIKKFCQEEKIPKKHVYMVLFKIKRKETSTSLSHRFAMASCHIRKIFAKNVDVILRGLEKYIKAEKPVVTTQDQTSVFEIHQDESSSSSSDCDSDPEVFNYKDHMKRRYLTQVRKNLELKTMIKELTAENEELKLNIENDKATIQRNSKRKQIFTKNVVDY